MVYSFDVYDTLITRVTAEPAGIFVYMQKIMSDSDCYSDIPLWLVEDFVRIRRESEIIARRKAGGREISFADIYRQMSDNHNIAEDHCRKISELEMNVEIHSSVVIQENIDRIEQLTKTGSRIFLISDMYMDKTFFEKLFSQVCPILNEYPLYISSEKGATKTSGKLFALMAAREQIPFREWTHIGDNDFSDVTVPELLGIRSELFRKKTDKFASARTHAIFNDMNGATAQFMIGIQNNNSFLSGTAAYRIGYSFLGIILYDYVRWIIWQTREMGVEALHFIARDGYLLKKIADVIIKREGLSIRTNYLYGSRKVWKTKSNDERKLASAYLQQELMEKTERFALVDIQGTGLSLDMILQSKDEKIPVFYYTSPMNRRRISTKPYIYSIQAGLRIIEVCCRAPHGLTIGYTKQKGKIIPLLEHSSDEKYVECGLHEYVRGVEDFVKDVMLFQERIGISLSFAEAAMHGMQYCENTPDSELVDFISEIPFRTTANGEETAFAPLLSEQDIKRIEFDRRQEPHNQPYAGIHLKYSYLRMNQWGQNKADEYIKAFYLQTANKTVDALHIAIFGSGSYGEELYRFFYLDESVVVDKVVDPNPDKNRNVPFKVEPISVLTETEIDYVVISNDYSAKTRAIRELLSFAGIDVEKIVPENTFWAMRRE